MQVDDAETIRALVAAGEQAYAIGEVVPRPAAAPPAVVA
jgi:hypothetical protein